jgi:hypothetical protein
MSRFIPQGDMSADEIVKCVIQAKALIGLCERSAWSDIQNGLNGSADAAVSQAAEDIQFTLQLARELLDPVQDALESHEGLKGNATAEPARMTGGQRHG